MGEIAELRLKSKRDALRYEELKNMIKHDCEKTLTNESNDESNIQERVTLQERVALQKNLEYQIRDVKKEREVLTRRLEESLTRVEAAEENMKDCEQFYRERVEQELEPLV